MYSDAKKFANCNGRDFGRSLTGPFRDARRFPSKTTVSRTRMYTYAAKVLDLSIVQGPLSVAPYQTQHNSQIFRRILYEWKLIKLIKLFTALKTASYAERSGGGLYRRQPQQANVRFVP